MSNGFRTAARASLIALMAGFAPVASAIGQDMAQPNESQRLIQQAAAQQPVGHPASMAPVVSPGDPGTAGADVLSPLQPVADAIVTEQNELASLDAEVAALRPGQFVWKAERAASGPVEMVVSLPQQRMYVYRGGRLIGASTVSTGRAGHRTPTGSFTILEKRRRHFSNLYNNAPMPNMQRLTWGGIALHAGQLPGYPASHGCVRLPMEFSRLLFDTTQRGQRVHIINGSPTARDALAMATGRGGTQLAAR